MLPRETRAIGVDPFGVEVVARRRLRGRREFGGEVRAGETGAVRQAAAHPFQQASRFAAETGTVVDRDGTQATDQFGRGVRLAVQEVLDELDHVHEEVGRPPFASPIGQILGSQALLHVLSARRYGTVVDQLRELIDGNYGSTPAPIDEGVTRAIRRTYGEPVPPAIIGVMSGSA